MNTIGRSPHFNGAFMDRLKSDLKTMGRQTTIERLASPIPHPSVDDPSDMVTILHFDDDDIFTHEELLLFIAGLSFERVNQPIAIQDLQTLTVDHYPHFNREDLQQALQQLHQAGEITITGNTSDANSTITITSKLDLGNATLRLRQLQRLQQALEQSQSQRTRDGLLDDQRAFMLEPGTVFINPRVIGREGPLQRYHALQLVRELMEACIQDKRWIRKSVGENELLDTQILESDFDKQLQKFLRGIKNADTRQALTDFVHRAIVEFGHLGILTYEPGIIGQFYRDIEKPISTRGYHFSDDLAGRLQRDNASNGHYRTEVVQPTVMQFTRLALDHLNEMPTLV